MTSAVTTHNARHRFSRQSHPGSDDLFTLLTNVIGPKINLYLGRWQYNVRPWDCVPQITWQSEDEYGAAFSYKFRYIIGFGLVEMSFSTEFSLNRLLLHVESCTLTHPASTLSFKLSVCIDILEQPPLPLNIMVNAHSMSDSPRECPNVGERQKIYIDDMPPW